MKAARAREVMEVLLDKLPEKKCIVVRNALAAADEGKAEAVLGAKLHGTLSVVLLSVFLGWLGVDRFVIGDVRPGVCKLLFWWLTLGIWPLIDIFFCYKKAKQKNFEKIMRLL